MKKMKFIILIGITSACSNGEGQKPKNFYNSYTATLYAGSEASGFATGRGTDAQFGYIYNLTCDSNENIYVMDQMNNVIEKVDTNQMVTIFAGGGGSNDQGFLDGIGTNAKFQYPVDIVLGTSGNFYVTDKSNYTIRKITPGGTVTTIAGMGPSYPGATNGAGILASFTAPHSLTVDNNENIYITNVANPGLIRKIDANKIVYTLGTNGSGWYSNNSSAPAIFLHTYGIVADNMQNVFAMMYDKNQIYKIDSANGSYELFVGDPAGGSGSSDGLGTNATLIHPFIMRADASNNLYVREDGEIPIIRKISPEGFVATLVIDNVSSLPIFYSQGIAVCNATNNIYISTETQIYKLTPNYVLQ